MDCAFPLDAVQEIVPMATLFVPPGLPSGLAGFLDLRGTAVPIVRLDRLFALPEREPGLHTPMIVLRGAADPLGVFTGPIGVLVDSVYSIVPAPSSQLLNIPESGTFRGCATGALELDGGPVHLLSAAALLQRNEVRVLADHRAIAQGRLLHLDGTQGEGGWIDRPE